MYFKSRISTVSVVAVLLFISAFLPLEASASDVKGVFCSVFGTVLWPFGLCEEVLTYKRIENPADSKPTPNSDQLLPKVLAVTTNVPGKPVFDTLPYVAESVTFPSTTNSPDYVTLDEVEAKLDERLIVYLNSIISVLEGMKGSTKSGDSSEMLEISRRNSENTRDDIREVLSLVSNESDATLTDTTLSGATTLANIPSNSLLFANGSSHLSAVASLSYENGRLGIGTSSPSDILSVNGALYLGSVTPTTTNNRLYNDGGDLYWNGVVVGSSSAAVWSSGGGNVFRTIGNVGIGSTSPSETLTVAGTLSAGTSTVRLVDTGGQVCNVEAYGAVGDNSTLNDAAIAAAIAACGEGGTVYFPMGQFRISTPIVLDTPITLRGAYSPRWSYSSTPRSSIRADFGSFSGTAIIHVRDRTISGQASDNNGGRLEYISLDGGSASSGVEGVYFEGLVRDWKLTDVDISQVTGNGFEAAVGTGYGNPRGFTIRGLSIYSADGHGFRATALNDSYIEDLLAVGNSLRGIYLSSMGETKVNNSRAVFNGLSGLYIDGSSSNGGITFTDFSTDRNDRHGVRISSTGTSTVVFNGLLTRRDGPNTSGGSETPYAGVAIIGSTTAKVAPVFINGLAQTVGVDDVGDPPLSPTVGVRVTNAEYVKIDGQLWGVTDAYTDGGGNDNFIIEDDSVLKTGTAGAQALYSNSRKWQATTTGLYYGDGTVNIGSSTGSTRLLNIIAPDKAGARLQDTTNDVIFDMRAEDTQAFFGTFSNHQLRFQSNNTSRLTIDTNGNIGIGTTSPTAQLHTTGSLRLSTFGVGTLQTDANGNVSAASDEILKNVLGDFEAGLDEILQIEPIRYKWNELSGFDEESIYAGFSAQNIKSILPMAVGEDSEGYLTLSDRPILAAVVTAIKEMWQAITGNQNKIAELEARLEILEEQSNIASFTEEEETGITEPDESEPNIPEELITSSSSATTTEPATEDTDNNETEVDNSVETLVEDEEVVEEVDKEEESEPELEVMEEEKPTESSAEVET